MTSQLIGEFEITQRSVCKNCPYQELELLDSFIINGKISIHCKHRDICNRIYDMGVEETPITVSYDPEIKCVNVTCEKCRSTFSIPDEVKVYNFCPKCGSKWNLTSRQMGYIMNEQALSQKRDCKTCKWSENGHRASTEECHLCMWEIQYEAKQSCNETHVCLNCKYACVSAYDIPCSDCCRGNGMETDHWVAKEESDQEPKESEDKK